jgi:hypothetical protein
LKNADVEDERCAFSPAKAGAGIKINIGTQGVAWAILLRRFAALFGRRLAAATARDSDLPAGYHRRF